MVTSVITMIGKLTILVAFFKGVSDRYLIIFQILMNPFQRPSKNFNTTLLW